MEQAITNILSSEMLPALALMLLGIIFWASIGLQAFADHLQTLYRNHKRRQAFNRIKRS